MKFIAGIILTLSVSSVSLAGLLIDLGGTYLNDSLGHSSGNTSSTKYFYEAGLMFSLTKSFWGGWCYSGISHVDVASSTTTNYSSSDTGPCIKWFVDKDGVFSFTGAYNLISRATYTKTGSTNEQWEGTSYWASFGIMPVFGDSWHIGVTINYFAANYTKATVGTTDSNTTNTKSWTFPALALTKSW